METQKRPPAVTITVGLMVLFTVLTWVAAYLNGKMSVTAIPFLIIGMVLLWLVLRAFWQGERWARHLVLICSILTLVGPENHWHRGWLAGVVMAGQCFLSIFLLFWLNGSEGRTYFKAVYRDEPGTSIQSPSAS